MRGCFFEKEACFGGAIDEKNLEGRDGSRMHNNRTTPIMMEREGGVSGDPMAGGRSAFDTAATIIMSVLLDHCSVTESLDLSTLLHVKEMTMDETEKR